MFYNFWRISAYFRRSCFCSRRLSIFKPGTKIQSDFCPRLFWYLERIVLHKKRPALWVRTGKELKMKKCFVLLRLFVDMLISYKLNMKIL
ncbi:hypothetical protein DXT35_10185 [Enterococcus faecalis]|nr:hypothetical protein [Enterococcus faecalis]EGO8372336.1 hypothetical protein [Enterococcus faecalis]EGO8410621.1 hypothetical protein [Enterococcus faecalis]EGO8603610.1 hypothetical protein [Enterococcus faecalis]EGO8645505.1 hypothetical protein [Enterococcus faecalis]